MHQSSGADLKFNYDRDADVLYVTIGAPRSGRAEHFDDDVLLRYALDSDELIGLTILGFREMGGLDEVLRRLTLAPLATISGHETEIRKLVYA